MNWYMTNTRILCKLELDKWISLLNFSMHCKYCPNWVPLQTHIIVDLLNDHCIYANPNSSQSQSINITLKIKWSRPRYKFVIFICAAVMNFSNRNHLLVMVLSYRTDQPQIPAQLWSSKYTCVVAFMLAPPFFPPMATLLATTSPTQPHLNQFA